MTRDERFSIEPHFKRAGRYDHRNPTGLVRDGFALTDRVTGASRRLDTKREANAYIDGKLADEAALDWTRIRGWRGSFTCRSAIGLAEISGLDSNGARVLTMAVVAYDGRDEGAARARTRAWLEHVGHPDLPEVPGN